MDEHTISVGLMPSAPLSMVARATTTVRRRRPHVRVALVSMWADEMSMARIRDGDVDVALLIGPVGEPSVAATTVATLASGAFVAPDNPMACSREVHLDDLLDEPTFRRPEAVDSRWRSHWLQSTARGGGEPRFLDVAARTDDEALLAIATTRAVGLAPWSWGGASGLTRLAIRNGPTAPVQVVRPVGAQRRVVDDFCMAVQLAADDCRGRVSPAETRVAGLVARGMTSQEIADAL
ncbi:MAG: LysR substrate-binding domain-containing protein, partial [Phycicoccus sp.]